MTASAILFVCLGNICRSPMAEGAARMIAARRGLDIALDSAGTGGWHRGEPPDPRAIACARRHGAYIAGLRARQVTRADFQRFDHVIALDPDNLDNLARLDPPASRARLSLLLDHVPGHAGQGVADPYYGGDAEFERAWADIRTGVTALFDRIAAEDILG